MKKFGVLLALLATVHCLYIDNDGLQRQRIVGGFFDEIEKVPYYAQILQNGALMCGAAIYSNSWLITAAHCVDDLRGLSVMTGTKIRSFGGTEHGIETVVPRKDYDAKTHENDVALIKLKKPITFGPTQRNIPIATVPPSVGQTMKVSGFGNEGKNTKRSPLVKSMIVPVIDSLKCQKAYILKNYKIKDTMFCGATDTSDAGEGDSGGPAVIDDHLAGVVSFGTVNPLSGIFPGVYTNLIKYREWIEKVTRT